MHFTTIATLAIACAAQQALGTIALGKAVTPYSSDVSYWAWIEGKECGADARYIANNKYCGGAFTLSNGYTYRAVACDNIPYIQVRNNADNSWSWNADCKKKIDNTPHCGQSGIVKEWVC